MPFSIQRNNIISIEADAYVVPANPMLLLDAGVAGEVGLACGPEAQKACDALAPRKECEAVATPGFNSRAKHIIHVVSPEWRPDGSERDAALKLAYDNVLAKAAELEVESIAIPLLATGERGYDPSESLSIAIECIKGFLMEDDAPDMSVILALYSSDSVSVARKLFGAIDEYINDEYVDMRFMQSSSAPQASYSAPQHYPASGSMPNASRSQRKRRRFLGHPLREGKKSKAMPRESTWANDGFEAAESAPCFGAPAPAEAEMPKPKSLAEQLNELDMGFSETLLHIIDSKGLKDSDVYKKANLSRQHFSKIRNNPNYQPTKTTIFALAIALELNLQDSMDLLARAGFTFTKTSKLDIIVKWFIENGKYDIFAINETLFEYDLPLLS